MANLRGSRDTERRMVRDDETRSAEMLVSYNMKYVSPLDIPPEVKKAGYVYYWAPVHVRNYPLYIVEQLCSTGWSLVPASRAPGFCMDPFKRNALAGEYIFKMDTVLLEAPEHVVAANYKARAMSNRKKTRALQGVADDTANVVQLMSTV